MLRVPTLVRPSPIEGVGLFSAMPIPAGTVVWEYTPEVDWTFTAEELERVPEPFQGALRRYCYRESLDRYVLCGDNAKFMNHSFSPNCTDIDGPLTLAGRDIEAGEELTCDYRAFDLDAQASGLVEFSGSLTLSWAPSP